LIVLRYGQTLKEQQDAKQTMDQIGYIKAAQLTFALRNQAMWDKQSSYGVEQQNDC
jgi:hypothetical protein